MYVLLAKHQEVVLLYEKCMCMCCLPNQEVLIMCLYNTVIYLFVVNIVEHVTHIIFVLIGVVGECRMRLGKS